MSQIGFNQILSLLPKEYFRNEEMNYANWISVQNSIGPPWNG